MKKFLQLFVMFLLLAGTAALSSNSSVAGPLPSSGGIITAGTDVATPIYSIGTGNVPGETGHFASLKAAFDSLSHGLPIVSDITFYITSDITEPETGGKGIGLAVDPSPFTVTIKPYTGVQPTISLQYPSDGNSGPSGAFLIGMNGATMAWADLKPTRNIVIDGSNTVGGKTRDLTIQTTGNQRNAIPLVIVGDVSNLTIKNCNIWYKVVPAASTSGNLLVNAVLIRTATAANTGTVEKVPSKITIDNNSLSTNFAGATASVGGLAGYASAMPTSYPSGIVISNNKIEGIRRGIGLYLLGNTDIFNNEIIVNQGVADGLTSEGIYAATTSAASTYNIYNNKITKLSTISSSGVTTGITGISIESHGTFNIYNNMISGFALKSTNANKSAYLYGIKNSDTTAVANIFQNTIQMDTVASIGTGTVNYRGIYIVNGVNTVKNNIIANNEDDFATFNIYRANNGTPGTLLGTTTVDYNDYFRLGATNANTGFYDAASAKTLKDWQTASGQDAKSVSGAPQFVSATDLHINPTATPTSAASNAGTFIASVTTDIDGDLRSSTTPDIGADEFTAVVKAPVLTMTPASINFKNVVVNTPMKDSVTVKNTGTDSLFISTAVSSDPAFVVTPTAARLDTGASAKFYVTYTPTTAGRKTAFVVFSSNDSSATDTLRLAGAGLAPITIADARKDLNGDFIADRSVTKDTVFIYGVVNSPNYGASYPQLANFVQDTTGGLEIYGYTLPDPPLVPGDSVYVIGTVAQYKGVVEVTPLGLDSAHFGVLKHNAKVAVKRLTLHQFMQNPEMYEGQLIEIDTLYKATGTWPASGANGSVYVTNMAKTDTLQMYIDLDTEIDGSTEPVYPINVVGVISQYKSAAPFNAGYEIMPRYLTDIKAITVTGVAENTGLPLTYELMNNYPNPFNPSTQIKFALPKASMTKLVVYDMLGREVKTLVNGLRNAGYYEVTWDGSNNHGIHVSSGMYVYRIEAGSFTESKKMMLLK